MTLPKVLKTEPKSFAALIKAALATRTQAALAQRCGCSQQAISSYAAGTSKPPRTRIPQIAKALRVPAADLVALVSRSRRTAA